MPSKVNVSKTDSHSHKNQAHLTHTLEPQAINSQSLSSHTLQQARLNPTSLSHQEILQLQRTVGNKAVIQMLRTPPVQRLMALSEFKTVSDVKWHRRNKIKVVDNALRDYNAEQSTPAKIANKKALLLALEQACANFRVVRATSKKLAGLKQLEDQLAHEKPIIVGLDAANTMSNKANKFQKLVEMQDLQLELQNQGVYNGNNNPFNADTWLMGAIGELRADQTAMNTVIQSELNKLQAMSTDVNTPALTRQILTEVLANAGKVKVKEGLPQANFTDKTDTSQGYTVQHNLNAPLGSGERLGSLTHELTHVSVSETFKNTALYLAFERGASDDDIVNLSNSRSKQLDDLEKLMEADTTFTATQKSLLRNKIRYPSKDPAKSDITRYIKPNIIAATHPLAPRIRNLAATRGVNNSLVEFDTVINQMMIYMHMWKIPQTNDFYTELQDVAQEAYDYRGGVRATNVAADYNL